MKMNEKENNKKKNRGSQTKDGQYLKNGEKKSS